MYMYMYIYTYMCVNMYTCKYICSYMYICIYVNIYTCTDIYATSPKRSKASCHAYECAMLHVQNDKSRHVMRTNAPCDTYKWVKSHIDSVCMLGVGHMIFVGHVIFVEYPLVLDTTNKGPCQLPQRGICVNDISSPFQKFRKYP